MASDGAIELEAEAVGGGWRICPGLRVMSYTRPPGTLLTVVSTSAGGIVVHIPVDRTAGPPETVTVTWSSRVARVVVTVRFSCAQ